MNIVTQINPDQDGVRCGECEHSVTYDAAIGCFVFDTDGEMRMDDDMNFLRHPSCLSAEQKLKRLVEAGKRMRDELYDAGDVALKLAGELKRTGILGAGFEIPTLPRTSIIEFNAILADLEEG